MEQSEDPAEISWGIELLWNIIDIARIGRGSFSSILSAFCQEVSAVTMTTLFLKYIPSGFCLYKLLQSVYHSSRERIERKKNELEEIQLEIQIMATKLGARNADFVERAQLSRRRADRLRAVRARVREIIASDDTLRRILERASNWEEEVFYFNNNEGQEFKVSLLEDDNLSLNTARDGLQTDQGSSDNSYSQNQASGETKNCQVKISRVTKVHKVACLKHYIKQKRMRRASKQANLKKKIESIKKLMENWHSTLSHVISMQHPRYGPPGFDQMSQDSMGDFSKPNLRDSIPSGSETELRNAINYDDYSQSWCQNSYNSFHPYDDEVEENMVYEQQQGHDGRGEVVPEQYCDRGNSANTLFILPEETNSELAMEGMNKDGNNKRFTSGSFAMDRRDYVAV